METFCVVTESDSIDHMSVVWRHFKPCLATGLQLVIILVRNDYVNYELIFNCIKCSTIVSQDSKIQGDFSIVLICPNQTAQIQVILTLQLY